MAMNDNGKPLMDALDAYAAQSIVPMHMPGHKRNIGMLGQALPWQLDITEIDGFDDLHHSEGLLLEAMQFAAQVYHARRTIFLINGSSCGLLAGIRGCTRRGDPVLVAQNSHRAVFHALELSGLMPRYLAPQMDAESGIAGSISPDEVRRAFAEQPGAKLVVITSSTYEGVLSDVRSIAEIAHAHGALLLVDEAHGAHLPFAGRTKTVKDIHETHGAHLPFSSAFPESALQLGADIVVHSLHKTLPSLNQTALLHIASERVDEAEILRQLSIFETSSPSYPLMASIDDCVRCMARDGSAWMEALERRLDHFSVQMAGLRHLKSLGQDVDHPAFYARDPSRLVFLTQNAMITGEQLMERLSREHQIQLEMSLPGWATAITSVCDTDENFDRLARALLAIDAGLTDDAAPSSPILLPTMQQRLPIDQALEQPGKDMPLTQCAGRISQEYVWAYPPGIPLIAPGAEAPHALIDLAQQGGVRLRSTRGGLPDRLRIIC